MFFSHIYRNVFVLSGTPFYLLYLASGTIDRLGRPNLSSQVYGFGKIRRQFSPNRTRSKISMSKKVSEHELSDSSPTAAGKYAANLAGHGVPPVPYETASRGRLPRPRPRETVRKARDTGSR
jgi:hypothetical protein